MTKKIKGGKDPGSKSHKADKTAVHGRLDINVMKMMQALRISLGAVMGQIGLPPLEDAKTKDRFIPFKGVQRFFINECTLLDYF